MEPKLYMPSVRAVYGRSVRRVRGSFLYLGMVITCLTPGKSPAQTPSADTVAPLGPQPLTVRPREMATGTQNPQAGEYTLDSLPNYLVYVPERCVGTHRCPLVVFLHPAVETSRYVIDWQTPVADKYGMIILAPNSPNVFSRPNLPDSVVWRTADYRDQRRIDAAMKQVLKKYAVDPDKIAMIGYSGSGSPSIVYGGHSLNVFSRIIVISAGYTMTTGVDPQNKTTEFLFIDTEESRGNFLNVREVRRDGHPVKQVIRLGHHGMRAEDHDFLGHWLQESWTTPNPTARRPPSVISDSVPLLTNAIVGKMAAFWASFVQEPDSIWTAARMEYQREVVVPVGPERPSVVMVDMPALAAHYPSVAADLRSAGLTAQEHEAYRVALLSARISWFSGDKGPPGGFIPGFVEKGLSPVVEPNSTQAKNLEFLKAGSQELATLGEADMWYTP